MARRAYGSLRRNTPGGTGYNYAYNNTSVAYDYEREVRPAPPKRRRRPRGSNIEVYVQAADKREKPSLAVYGAIAAVFVCVAVSLASAAAVSVQRADNVKLAAELKSLQTETAELNAAVSGRTDLAEIERIAREELEMSEPMPHQIVRISIPRQSYAVSVNADSEAAEDAAEGFSLKAVADTIAGWF